MNMPELTKPYDLEERTYEFTRAIIMFVNVCPKTLVNTELAKQLLRSSASVGANYIEAQEALSRKDFAMRVKICRKEAKESLYWLRLLELKGDGLEAKRQSLLAESAELVKILSSIVEKVK